MSALERVCPNCGTMNSTERTLCINCQTNLITLSTRAQTHLPARWENAPSTALVLGATALLARVGLNLLTRAILPRLIHGSIFKRASAGRREPVPADQPDYIIRGWRSWSVHHGGEHSSGSEQFEWHIKRQVITTRRGRS